jgi:hypothetical protein
MKRQERKDERGRKKTVSAGKGREGKKKDDDSVVAGPRCL